MATATRIIQGTRIASLLGEGYIVNEAFIVVDATGSTPADRLYDALSATNLPAVGDAHPNIPNVFLSELRGDPAGVGADKVTVAAVYKAPEIIQSEPEPGVDTGTLQNTSSLQDVETRFDRFGAQIVLTSGVEATPQPGVAEIQIPAVIRSVQRREVTDPTSFADDYVGKVNSIAIWGEAARRWLCTRIDGVSTDFGQSYTVTYEFQRSSLLPYSPTGTYSSWDALLVYEDDSGRPIENPVLGESMQIVEIYEEQDFNTLGLPA